MKYKLNFKNKASGLNLLKSTNTTDEITTMIEDLPYSFLEKFTDQILKEVMNLNRVVYITLK